MKFSTFEGTHPLVLPVLSERGETDKRLVASEIGVPSPVMIVRGTEKLFVVVTPRELRPADPSPAGRHTGR